MNDESPSAQTSQLTERNVVPFVRPVLAAGTKSEASSQSTNPLRKVTDQHRKSLSKSMKKMWARRGGLSSEHRQKISISVVKWWAKRDGRKTSGGDPAVPRTANSLKDIGEG